MDQTFLSAALEYAKRGFHVFPLKPQSKVPLTKNGFKDATTDAATIRDWWTQTPNANIGIATGRVSGLWVVDVDGAYPNTFPPLPESTVKTSKGFHYYFAYPPEVEIRSRAKIEGACVDVRGEGGYIVVPPSIHPDGGVYEFCSA